MKIFITGGAGFIGSYMVDRLLQKHEVVVYDNLSSGKNSYVESNIHYNNYHFIRGDIKDLHLLKESMKGSDLVIHLAANPDIRLAIEDSSVDLYEGTVGTWNVLESMKINKIKDLIYSSSSVVYGEAKVLPTPEDYGPLLPISLYGASKLSAEGYISSYVSTFKMRAWIYRFANVIGERTTHGIIYDFIRKLKKNPGELEVLGNGQQKKSYILAEECVDAMIYGYEKSKNELNLFNIGSKDQIYVSEIADLVIRAFGDNTKIRYTGTERGWPGDVVKQHLSIERLKAIGWEPKHTSRESVEITVDALIKAYK